MRGLFVTLEGVEGSGKSTQARLIQPALEAAGHRCVLLREPGGEPTAERIRSLLLEPGLAVIRESELLLFLASRAQLTRNVIMPHLASGTTVICDRYGDSTVAYQGYARGLDIGDVKRLNAFATGGLAPDLTVLLDVPAEIGLRRQKELNRMESEPVEFHDAVRQGYLAEARLDPARIAVVDGLQPTPRIQAQLMDLILARLDRHSEAAQGDPL